MSLLIGILHILNDDPDRLRKRKKHGIVIPKKEGFSNAVLCSKIWTSPKMAEGKAAKTPSADSLDILSNPV